jgi:creatine kinase
MADAIKAARAARLVEAKERAALLRQKKGNNLVPETAPPSSLGSSSSSPASPTPTSSSTTSSPAKAARLEEARRKAAALRARKVETKTAPTANTDSKNESHNPELTDPPLVGADVVMGDCDNNHNDTGSAGGAPEEEKRESPQEQPVKEKVQVPATEDSSIPQVELSSNNDERDAGTAAAVDPAVEPAATEEAGGEKGEEEETSNSPSKADAKKARLLAVKQREAERKRKKEEAAAAEAAAVAAAAAAVAAAEAEVQKQAEEEEAMKQAEEEAAAAALLKKQAAAVAEELASKARSAFAAHPDNRCAKVLVSLAESGELQQLSFSALKQLTKCAASGLENPDSGLGCYAMSPADYDELNFFFDPVCNDYHNNPKGDKVHTTSWAVQGGLEGLPEDGVLDLQTLGLSGDEDPLSMRVRVGRNLKAFPLPGAMAKSDRIEFERIMLRAFASLIDNEAYGGSVYSMTPHADWQGVTGEAENPNLITSEKYNELVQAHVMFKDMSADPYLASAGIASDWPCGRGCYQSADGGFIIWFGEEDQLRIMCMGKGYVLNDVFDRLNTALQLVESIEGIEFATSSKYGFVTSCPSNLGTGMRASVHLKIPNLTADGTDAKAKAAATPLGLSVRGVGGEHTPIGADGTVDISPSSRLFVTEAEIITKLYNGIKLLLELENPIVDLNANPPGNPAMMAARNLLEKPKKKAKEDNDEDGTDDSSDDDDDDEDKDEDEVKSELTQPDTLSSRFALRQLFAGSLPKKEGPRIGLGLLGRGGGAVSGGSSSGGGGFKDRFLQLTLNELAFGNISKTGRFEAAKGSPLPLNYLSGIQVISLDAPAAKTTTPVGAGRGAAADGGGGDGSALSPSKTKSRWKKVATVAKFTSRSKSTSPPSSPGAATSVKASRKRTITVTTLEIAPSETETDDKGAPKPPPVPVVSTFLDDPENDKKGKAAKVLNLLSVIGESLFAEPEPP